MWYQEQQLHGGGLHKELRGGAGGWGEGYTCCCKSQNNHRHVVTEIVFGDQDQCKVDMPVGVTCDKPSAW